MPAQWFINEILSIEDIKHISAHDRQLLYLCASFENYRRDGGTYEKLKEIVKNKYKG